MSETNVGRWAVCGAGYIGKITRVLHDGTHVGYTINKHSWRSMAPQLLSRQYETVLDKISEENQ